MAINNFSLADIIDRIYLVLPTKFTKTEETNVYGFIKGIADALSLNTEMVDELFRQTNLVSASGEYVDDFITGMAEIGRKDGESDADYKERYLNQIFTYNATTSGIRAIVIDVTADETVLMYDGLKRGAIFDARHYYNDSTFASTYSSSGEDVFTGYIQFFSQPTDDQMDEMCRIISAVKTAGVKVYIRYPV